MIKYMQMIGNHGNRKTGDTFEIRKDISAGDACALIHGGFAKFITDYKPPVKKEATKPVKLSKKTIKKRILDNG